MLFTIVYPTNLKLIEIQMNIFSKCNNPQTADAHYKQLEGILQ